MDLIQNPLKLVNDVFNLSCEKKYDPTWVDKVSPTFLNHLRNERLFERIPVLTGSSLGSLHINSLVRYTGLVQDTFDPEWYTAIVGFREDATGTCRQLPLAFNDAVPTGGPGESDIVHQEKMERR